jgi:hypothetical protein
MQQYYQGLPGSGPFWGTAGQVDLPETKMYFFFKKKGI